MANRGNGGSHLANFGLAHRGELRLVLGLDLSLETRRTSHSTRRLRRCTTCRNVATRIARSRSAKAGSSRERHLGAVLDLGEASRGSLTDTHYGECVCEAPPERVPVE